MNANRRYFETGLEDLGLFRQRWGEAIDAVITERRSWTDTPALLADRAAGGMKSVVVMPAA